MATGLLSSNDGCANGRSNEAKALGIPMGDQAFKYRELFEWHKVVKFSANFERYAVGFLASQRLPNRPDGGYGPKNTGPLRQQNGGVRQAK